MVQFLREQAFAKIEKARLAAISQQLESDDNTQIQVALDFLAENLDYQKAICNRYLYFLQARLQDSDATLVDMKRMPKDDAIGYILFHMPDMNHWRFEGEEGQKAWAFLVDFGGALIKAHFDVERYWQHTIAYYQEHQQLDLANSPIAAVGDILKDKELILGEKCWFDKVLEKLLGNDLQSITFEGVNAAVVNEAIYFGEFLIFLQGLMKKRSKLNWYFFDSTMPNFPSSIYTMNQDWSFGTNTPIIAPQPLSADFNETNFPFVVHQV